MGRPIGRGVDPEMDRDLSTLPVVAPPLPTKLPRVSLGPELEALVVAPYQGADDLPRHPGSFQDLFPQPGGPAGGLDALTVTPYQGADGLPRQPISFQDLSNMEAPEIVISEDPRERMKTFNVTTGHILAEAFRQFPVQVSTIPRIAGPEVGVNDKFYRDTLKWLEAEGFIRFSEWFERGNSSMRADVWAYTLTGKGLSILTNTPQSLKMKEESLGSAMVSAAKRGAMDSLQSLTKEVLHSGAIILGKVAVEHLKKL